MPKHDFLSPKAIAIRIKAKGLQKLRWYCEMCQKQCRDENGFKCHQTSEAHLRQMRLFAENPDRVMEGYSKEFEQNFVETLSRRHGTKRVAANVVYQEYISDKQHTHMNATRWETLTNFVKYLGRTGQCVVDETEKGWFIQWIDRDPATLARQALLEERRKNDQDEKERADRDLERRVKRARKDAAKNTSSGVVSSGATALPPTTDDDNGGSGQRTVSLAVATDSARAGGVRRKRTRPDPPASVFGVSNQVVKGDDGDDGDGNANIGSSSSSSSSSKPATAVSASAEKNGETTTSKGADETKPRPSFMTEKRKKTRMIDALVRHSEEEAPSKKKTETEPPSSAVSVTAWLRAGIVVKILDRRLRDGAYHRKKATVERVVSGGLAAVVRVHDSGDELQLDQDDLETVIPNAGKTATLLRGACVGQRATLLAVDVANFAVSVRILPGEPDADRVLDRVPYEDLSKTAR